MSGIAEIANSSPASSTAIIGLVLVKQLDLMDSLLLVGVKVWRQIGCRLGVVWHAKKENCKSNQNHELAEVLSVGSNLIEIGLCSRQRRLSTERWDSILVSKPPFSYHRVTESRKSLEPLRARRRMDC